MDFKGTRERFLERMHVDGFRRAAELAGETGHAVVVVGDAGLGPAGCLLYTSFGQWQSWVFAAGANGVMTGNYLTTKGCAFCDDAEMYEVLGLREERS